VLCYLCARTIQDDKQEGGLCSVCSELIYRNNERVKVMELLEKAKKHCPDWLRREIEEAVINKPPFEL
jgi:hypothetical protein